MAMKEMNQPSWWLNYYKMCCKDLCKRIRQYLEGDLDAGVLTTLVEGVESTLNDMKTED